MMRGEPFARLMGVTAGWRFVHRAAALLAVFSVGAGAILAAFLLVMPSSSSQREAVMGDHAAFVQDASATPLGTKLDLTACNAAVERVAAGACVAQLNTFGQGALLQPGSAAPTNLMVFEADWQSRPMGERFTLLSGRWPSAPGEVALTNALPPATAVSAWGDRVRLRIVGTIDSAGLDPSDALVGPGTFSSQSSRGLEMSGISASLQILTDGDPLVAATAGYKAVGRPAPSAEVVAPNTFTSGSVTTSPLAEKGAWYRLLPALLLAVLGGLVVLVRTSGPVTRLRAMAARTGVDDSYLAGAVTAVMVLWGLLASTIGTIVGAVAVGVPGHWLVHRLRPDLYLSPVPADPHFLLIPLAAVVPLVALVVLTRSARSRVGWTLSPGRLALLGIVLLGVGLPLSQIGDAPGKHTWLWTGSCLASAGAACLTTLLLVAWNHTPRKTLPVELGRRIRRGLLPGQVPLVAALASLLAVVACVTTSLGATIASLDDQIASSATAPQGAAYFRADAPAVRALIPAVTKASGTTAHGMTFSDGTGIVVATDVQGVVAAVGRPLTAPEIATLDAGGVLLPASLQPNGPVTVDGASGTREIPGRALVTYDRFLATRPGVMTAAGYRRAGLGSSGPAMFYLLTGPDAPTRVARAATSMGIGPTWYSVSVPQRHYLRDAWQRFQPVATALLSAAVMIALVGSVASRLRNYRARMRALGLPETWGLRTVLVHAACLAVVVLVSVVFGSVLTYQLIRWQTPPEGRVFRHFPWSEIIRLESGILAGSLLGTLLIGRRLFSNERLS